MMVMDAGDDVDVVVVLNKMLKGLDELPSARSDGFSPHSCP